MREMGFKFFKNLNKSINIYFINCHTIRYNNFLFQLEASNFILLACEKYFNIKSKLIINQKPQCVTCVIGL